MTEYAWAATTCDACPGPVLGGADFALLGADVFEGPARRPAPYAGANFVLTRLHARYGKDLADDLVFKAARPISGGRDGDRVGARPDDHDNFQARYNIRHPWTRPVTCAMPRRGLWDGRPREFEAEPATGVAFARRGASLSPLVMYNVPELGLRAYRNRHRPRPRSAPATR